MTNRQRIEELEDTIEELKKEIEFLKSSVIFDELETYTIGDTDDPYGNYCFV